MNFSPEHAPQGARYQHGAVGLFADQLRQRGRVSFPFAELIKTTGLSSIAARRQLHRLGARVVRVAPRQGYFLIVDPEHHLIGAPPVSWWLDAYFQWLKRPYYLALQSAASEYGSAIQAIQVTQVMTNKPRHDIELGRLRVQFFVKQAIEQTPTQPLSNAFAPLAVSSPAATTVDLVRYAQRVGGIERALETFQPLLPRIKPADLTQALVAVELPVVQRLGFMLDTLGHSRLAAAARALLPDSLKPVLLDTGANMPSNASPPLNDRWSVIVNASVEHP
jgi:hypothetical protein